MNQGVSSPVFRDNISEKKKGEEIILAFFYVDFNVSPYFSLPKVVRAARYS